MRSRSSPSSSLPTRRPPAQPSTTSSMAAGSEADQSRSCICWRTALPSSTKLLPNLGRRIAHRLQFPERDGAWHVFHATIGRRNETIGRHIFQAVANAVGDRVDALDLGVCEVEHTEHDFL